MNSTCQATVFYDEVGEASARLYALAAPTIDDRLLTLDELAECRFDCRVEGPTCRYSTTLPSRITLKHRGVTNWGDIPAVMAEGILPDPCTWSSELPFLYRLTGRVTLGDSTIAEIDQKFGIRPLSVVGNRLKFQEKTWVPRGVVCRPEWIIEVPLERWRETSTMMIVEDPLDSLLSDACEVGVFMGVTTAEVDVNRAARRLSRFPVVAFITGPNDVDELLLAAARNSLFLSEFQQASTNRAQVFCLETEWPAASWHWPQERTVPIIAMRSAGSFDSFTEARSGCDTLQRDLAGRCDPAGYFV